jgi:hypothetical protein
MLLDEGFSHDMCRLRQPQIILERLIPLIWSLLFKKILSGERIMSISPRNPLNWELSGITTANARASSG